MKVVIETFTKSFIFISITEQLNASINNILPAINILFDVLLDQCRNGDIPGFS
jgi:hypothetical protein